ncbi:kynureninase [Arenicella chitinivorans]|uniref:Kynureninase n=1 Tax=Arenicella chitinivorans TaxID=1329800 RepID=A0A918VHH9_9GAMM|nr:kynureninase [Arenicella chitinivorans]GGZ98154.1 kynureninase [Arenicella chitinivorans]
MTCPDSIRALDQQDPLKHTRALFELPVETQYLDGNSLGPLPRASRQRLEHVVQQQWGQDLITSWNKHGWIRLSQQVGDKIGTLIGAAPGQVVCCDSTSVNLFKVLSTALQIQAKQGRHRIVSQRDNFPTDLYMVEGLASLLGETRCELVTLDTNQLIDHLDNSVAVLMLTQVNFRTGYCHDMRALTEAAHKAGVLVIWDLAHSAGAMPLSLDEWKVDFAVGCGYKYLNGGPGAPAFVYAASRHHGAHTQPLSGWMGHAKPFEFSPNYTPAPSINQYLCGTPSVLAMSALDAALDVFDGVDLETIRAKSLALSDLFINILQAEECWHEFCLLTPAEHAERGSQVALAHPHGYAITQALIAARCVADFRAPDVIRFGFTPLYLRYEDVWLAAQKLIRIVREQDYLRPEFSKSTAGPVT